MSNLLRKWRVVIGVLYWTALWQVDDFPEQNGSRITASAIEKRHVVEKKEKYFMVPNIETWEIISILSIAWKKSFARVKTNKNAISEIGWFPYN